MRRIFPLLAILFSSQFSFSQLYVGPQYEKKDHFVYVKDALIFVANDIHLNKNFRETTEASIYLRNKAQLIQGHLQDSPNTGNGFLSVFQSGSANAYNYNFWAAPIGNSSGKNGLFGISMLHAPQTETSSIPAGTTSSLNGTSNPLTISNRWIYTYSGHNYSDWHYVGSETNIPAGYGYSMKGGDGTDNTMVENRANNPGNAQRYDFRGRPNSGTIEIPIAPDNIILVGNPYPSSLDLSLFLLQNSGTGVLSTECYGQVQRRNATTGIAYFWDSDQNGNSHYLQDYVGGYGAFSPVAPCTLGLYEAPLLKTYGAEEKYNGQKGQHYNRKFLPIAQGFMVRGTEGNSVVFENAQRVYQPQEVEKDIKSHEDQKMQQTAKEVAAIPSVKLQVKMNENFVRGLTLGFWATATAGVDVGMDALAYDLSPTDAGWLLDEKSYIIHVRPFDLLDEIPLYLEVEQHSATFVFSAGKPENADIENIFILDQQTNIYHSIFKDTFEITLDPGLYHGRFKLTFVKNITDTQLPENINISEDPTGAVSVFQNNRLGELQIISESYASTKSVGIYDLQGRRIFFRSNFGNRRSISLSTQHLASGVYLIKIIDTNNESITKKVLVLNWQ